MKRRDVTSSSRNVFADLDMADSDEALTKAEIASRICNILSERKLDQTRAAGILGIDQQNASALVRGRLDGFSLERLFGFLNALDQDVEITIRPKARGARHGGVRVVSG